LIPGSVVVLLLLLWAVHNGGYDADTWYWGALVCLATLAGVLAARDAQAPGLSRPARVALATFTLYVLWSYLSITWARSPGDALDGSNRALLYLLIFALVALVPWTPEAALTALVAFAVGVGLIAAVMLVRLASAAGVEHLVIDGRLAAPTGYFNSTAALFTIDAVVSIALAARRELPSLARAVLLTAATASLQLAVIVQSRGWLFTLPVIAVIATVVVRQRLRVAAAALLPIIGAALPIKLLLDVYQITPGASLNHAASRAGYASLAICAVILVVGWALAGWDARAERSLDGSTRRRLGTALAVVTIGGACIGAFAATGGHPFHFISRQWNGFSHVQTAASSTLGSHFGDVGSGRYDFWRVSLDALKHHPIGGLGQDNFADYYVTERHTTQEPAWTHSLELRLLAHTGLVGFALFAAFIIAALVAAGRAVRGSAGELRRGVAAVALLPLMAWLVHGSVDWFWEMPALSGPALGFLGMSAALGSSDTHVLRRRDSGRRVPVLAARVAGVAALVLATLVLGLPYLSVREVSNASNLAISNPTGALRDLATAADLNPLSPVPGRLAGRIALSAGEYEVAEQRFSQAISREPGGWFAWFGDGLAASQLGDVARARHDFGVARSIDSSQPAIQEALARVDTPHPMSASDALRAIVLTQ
jgi:hypothetical protein